MMCPVAAGARLSLNTTFSRFAMEEICPPHRSRLGPFLTACALVNLCGEKPDQAQTGQRDRPAGELKYLPQGSSCGEHVLGDAPCIRLLPQMSEPTKGAQALRLFPCA